jgi:hypothetical protein
MQKKKECRLSVSALLMLVYGTAPAGTGGAGAGRDGASALEGFDQTTRAGRAVFLCAPAGTAGFAAVLLLLPSEFWFWKVLARPATRPRIDGQTDRPARHGTKHY